MRRMRSSWQQTATVLLVSVALAGTAGAQVRFSAGPAVTRSGDRVAIAFTLSAPADVEVAIVDASNRVVRHLAAGVLTTNVSNAAALALTNSAGVNLVSTGAPPPPFIPGLAQKLEWDDRDDFGNQVPGSRAPVSVRVRAGMGVKFGKILGSSPYSGFVTSGAPADSLATAPDGTLYIKMASLVPQLHEGMPWQLRRFDKTGKYQKTLLPYPPSTDPAKTPGFTLLDAGNGLLTPAGSSGLDAVFFRFGDNIHNKLVDGQIVFVDNNTARLTFFKVDGSNAARTIPMRSAPGKLKWASWLSPQVAFSPDGRYAYYSNVANTPYDGKKPADIDPNFPQGRIYRQDVTAAGTDPETFYDLELPDFERTRYWMPSAWDKKTAAAGITVDSKGNLFVCDLVNQEVVEVSPEGKKLSAARMPWPDKVAVNSRDGTLYVISTAVSRGYKPPSELLKVTGRGADAKVVAKLPLKGAQGLTLALDESGATPVIWLGGEGEVVRVEDRGETLAVAGGSLINPSANDITFLCYGAVDPETEQVYATTGMGPVWRYDGLTGEGGLLPIKACDVAVGPNGFLYAWGDTGSYAGQVARYTRDCKPAPVASTGKHLYGTVYGRFGRGNNAPGMAVDWKGQVYVCCGFNNCHVRAYDAEGKLIEYERRARFGDEEKKPVGPAFLSYVLDQGGSMRADPAGNLYVLEIGLPKGLKPPRGFEKDPAFARCTGVIYKFTSKGGEFKRRPDGSWDADGAVAVYLVPSGPLSGNWNSTGSVCHCMRTRFDVDAYGRLYIPNGITYDVAVRDNADNAIVNFGGYGNWDARGPESSEPKPAIAFGWPIFAGATDEHIYVGDGLNHRIVRVDKTFAASATCKVP